MRSTSRKTKKAKKQQHDLAVAHDHGGVLIEKPAPIDNLPYEIRRNIILYLDPYSVLNMLLVSKSFYLTLRQSSQAEKDWERLCKATGAKRKSPGKMTWHANFLHLLHKHCVICLESTNEEVGQLLLYGFKNFVACKKCQSLHGPMHLDTPTKLALKYGLTLEHLQTIPRCSYRGSRKPVYRNHTLQDPWIARTDQVYVLDAAVCQLKLHVTKMEPILLRDCPFDQELLSKALEHSEIPHDLNCVVLNRAVATLRLTPSPLETHYMTVISLYQAFQTILDSLRDFEAQGGTEMSGSVPKLDSVWCSLANVNWIDALVLGKTTFDKYVEAVRQEKAKRDELLRRVREEQEAEYERFNRICGQCDGLAAKECVYSRCARCCPGDCYRHEGYRDERSGRWYGY